MPMLSNVRKRYDEFVSFANRYMIKAGDYENRKLLKEAKDNYRLASKFYNEAYKIAKIYNDPCAEYVKTKMQIAKLKCKEIKLLISNPNEIEMF